MMTNLTSLAKPLFERAARCVGAVMVWRKARAGRAARARLEKSRMIPKMLKKQEFGWKMQDVTKNAQKSTS